MPPLPAGTYTITVGGPDKLPVVDPVQVEVRSSTASTDVTVPDVVGRVVADARSVIAAVGLIARVQPECSSTIPNGVVISANPPEGTTLPKGSDVSIRVSLGPCPG